MAKIRKFPSHDHVVYLLGFVLALESPANGLYFAFPVTFPVALFLICALRLAAVDFDNPLVYFLGTFLIFAIS